MAAWSRILVEPIFRLIFGRPLADRLPWGHDNDNPDVDATSSTRLRRIGRSGGRP